MNIKYTPREENHNITDYINKSIQHIKPIDYYIDETLEASDLVGALGEDLPENKNKDSLIQDICQITMGFITQTKSKNVRLQLLVIKSNKCRLFHVDNNVQRLLCTYHGLGTEWLDESNINREALGKGDNSLIVKDFSKVRSTSEFDILLLKGGKYSASNKGAVHRSPEIESINQKRVLFKLDECDNK